MRKTIQRLVQDEEDHWVAVLACGHRQHVRHRPPFFPRLEVTSEEGRRRMVGETLKCVLCDRERA